MIREVLGLVNLMVSAINLGIGIHFRSALNYAISLLCFGVFLYGIIS